MSTDHLTLMIQGTTSDAGKSTLVAGLGRVFSRKGLSVAPFKPQNMALNSMVSDDGGEIGRAQAVQAQACRVPTSVHMNPILIKPSSDTGAQVIVQGHSVGNFEASDYHDHKPRAMAAVLESYQILKSQYPYILVEGAGSPAEVNLREGDIANMGFAESVDCPVILVTDIDRGGSFAHLFGTLECLSKSEQARIVGFVINKFRGDVGLLMPGVDWLEEKTGKPVLGIIPYLQGFYLEAEDAITTEQIILTAELKICVLVLPRISNHTDFDTLRLHPSVDLSYVGPGAEIPPCDLIIIPGSKSVRQDLEHLRESGWDTAIERHLRYGGKLLGICGGYQMLGKTIDDPEGVEGIPGSCTALALFDSHTVLKPHKTLNTVTGTLCVDGCSLTGYEIHMGETIHRDEPDAFSILRNEQGTVYTDGARSIDNQIWGTYVHGLFDCAEAQRSLLGWAGLNADVPTPDYAALKESEIDRLADTLESYFDVDRILPHR